VHPALQLPDLLRLIDERSTAFRAVVSSAPDLDVPVPSCPGWTLADLAQHIGAGRRSWAATVALGEAATGRVQPDPDEATAPGDRAALDAWLAASTQQLLDALRDAGPDRPCWTWWATSQSPQTSGAVARHQLQEVAVHTWDAQAAAGAPAPLPREVALDGVEEFLSTCVATTSRWPYEPATVVYRATEGPAWRLRLSAGGARVERTTEAAAAEEPEVTASATASDLVLVMYGRLPVDALAIDGDRRPLDGLVEWEPED
jgi:uncharacterized protein (TIGR03083 family)